MIQFEQTNHSQVMYSIPLGEPRKNPDEGFLKLFESHWEDLHGNILLLNCGYGGCFQILPIHHNQKFFVFSDSIEELESCRKNKTTEVQVLNNPDFEMALPLNALILKASHSKKEIFRSIHYYLSLLSDHSVFYLWGFNEEGIKSYQSILEDIFLKVELGSTRAKGRVYICHPKPKANICLSENPALTQTSTVKIPQTQTTFHLTSTDGVFSAEGLDPATEKLLESLPTLNQKTIFDCGTGSGVLSIAALHLGAKEVTSIDNSYQAIQLCTINWKNQSLHFQERWKFRWDTFYNSPIEKYDILISNPPFHLGKRVSRPLIELFLNFAKYSIHTDGACYVVLPKSLSQLPSLEVYFNLIETLETTGSHRVLKLAQPQGNTTANTKTFLPSKKF